MFSPPDSDIDNKNKMFTVSRSARRQGGTPAYAYQIPLEGGECVRQSSECQVIWNLDIKAVSCAKGGV
jgi:hypothetical protein